MSVLTISIIILIECGLTFALCWMIWNERKIIVWERQLYHRIILNIERKVRIMLKSEAVNAIRTALKNLGVKGSVTVERMANPNRWFVKIDGKYFGIFDVDKRTFVD